MKGRFLFVLDETGEKLENYKTGYPSLKGRMMFVNEKEGNQEAAFMIMNDPKKDGAYIQELVKKRYLIRTRADANTREARLNDYSMFEAAKEEALRLSRLIIICRQHFFLPLIKRFLKKESI